MNRRNFFAALGSLAALPLLPNIKLPKSKATDKSTITDELYFKFHPDEFSPIMEIIKGPYSTKIQIQDCRHFKDCHGLCATDEMTAIVVQNLELGEENIREMYSYSWVNMEKYRHLTEPGSAWKAHENSLRRFYITREERSKIHNMISAMRGPHNCAHNTWKKIDTKIVYRANT